MARRKSPEEAVEVFDSAERDLKFQRKLKIAENEAKLAKARLSASEIEVESLKKRIEVLSGLSGVKAKGWKPSRAGKPGQATAVLLLSDLHVEENIEPEKVNGLNKFNLEIADRSLKEVFQRTLMLLEHERHLVNIKDMVIWLGGDVISGRIHPEFVETGELPPLAACRWVQERLQSGIKFLSDNADLSKIKIVTSFGNHGRTTEKRRIATGAENSYEYNLYQVMRASMDDKRLDWQISEGYLNYTYVQEKLCRFHHGDALKFGGGIGGITTTVEKAIKSWDQQAKADYTFQGHFHQFRAAPHWVSNGSLIGYSPFAIEIKAEFEEPSQTFCVIDKDRGMTVVKKVFCRPPWNGIIK